MARHRDHHRRLRPLSPRATFWRVMALMVFCAVAGFGAIIGSRRPSNERPWAADHAQLAEIIRSDSLVRIANVRDFHYRTETDLDARYETRTYNLNQVTSAWLVLAPFSKAFRGAAHSFVSFGFADSSYLAISVEARREQDKTYGLLRGLGRNFELIYVIGEERDLIGRRAAFGDGDVYLYPIRTTPERARAVLVDMLDRADQLARRPEFYNTFSNNCISNLVRHVNRVVPGRIPTGLNLLMPGYADEVARNLGLLDSTMTLDQTRARYRINEVARRYLDSTDFSARIRTH